MAPAEELTEQRAITVEMVRTAINIVVFESGPRTVESPELPCEYRRLCDETFCRFPRYSRNGAAVGLVAKVLVQLGYPQQLLLDLDREHEMGEVIHPGVKLRRSRNAALTRIDAKGIELLNYLQEHQKTGVSWGDLSLLAFGPNWTPKLIDRRRRPWLY